jgi:DNA-binding transcriptional ArsR family regulator
MTKSSIIINFDDPRSDKIADAISNKTSKKILSLLAENEMSGSEIAEKLNLPLNTVTYNLKNLVDSGLVEKSKRLFWSSKGKRMELYKVSNKRIVIFPKMMIKGILPAIFITCIIAALIAFSFQPNISQDNFVPAPLHFEKTASADVNQESSLMAASRQGAIAASAESGSLAQDNSQEEAGPREAIYNTTQNVPDVWAWYLIGGMTTLVIVILWNWRKN